jgi:hypothetical protein
VMMLLGLHEKMKRMCPWHKILHTQNDIKSETAYHLPSNKDSHDTQHDEEGVRVKFL